MGFCEFKKSSDVDSTNQKCALVNCLLRESRTAQTCRNMISTLWLSCHYLKTSSLLKILLKNRGTSTSTFRRTFKKSVGISEEIFRRFHRFFNFFKIWRNKDWIVKMNIEKDISGPGINVSEPVSPRTKLF